MSIYFMDHFYFGSEINSINVSGQSVEKVEEQMKSNLQAYSLNLRERGGKEEQVRAADIGLKYSPDGLFKSFKDKQNPYKWIPAFFYTNDSKIKIEVAFDEKLLRETLDRLSCFNKNNVIEPKNPTFRYVDNGYVIEDEINGNKVNKYILYYQVANAMLRNEPVLDLEAADCYIKPEYTSKSQRVLEVKDILNKYVSSKVTYAFGENKEIIDGTIINKWINIDENYQITIDEKKVKDYVNEFSNKYKKIGNIKSFVTSSGNTISITGGDYNWLINTDKEAQDLIAAIKGGQIIAKEPTYAQNAYVEIDLTQQHLWFYKNGSLIVQGDIVSGNMGSGHTTPGGAYRLKYKETKVVLRGPGYAAPVDFWMPFNGGIGIHDATWRSRFGGQIYKWDGSHGCINCPYSLAKTIYDNIEADTPVICYY